MTEPLADAKRQFVVDRILTSARRLVITAGLGVTMDQIAEAAGVSRRTLFRHFDTRDRLIATAFTVAGDQLVQQWPLYDGDVHGWLQGICEVNHRGNSNAGPGYWELTSRTDLPPDLADFERSRRALRRERIAELTRQLWDRSGGAGDPPAALVASVSAHLSAHFTAAVVTEHGSSWEAAAEIARDAILAALHGQLAGTGCPPVRN
ncbi:TetR/AcrR family transcriptional regulator [Trujillonella endophytica]|uniref:Transcriptional regulator, TetR family n=1 Tax=Trujillonella endophytica TaxID=673521 RepID=A0A1H8SVK3_9ACTN|nr:TetR/AcrR family transcriptional regulator [Trujillella endophytica]SEO83009.1 transcriptional regulator, TetR family [Trujillella endophytica]